ncbi:hypothetical protein D0860_05074 [Hortaea werneckii]|uniref:Myb-like domain-containing protein n=1 Tax=Hortaea werneckii TaxID=91943 RepID=A0A3M7H2U8_HORWE|nr:hypothetical protein D0860_05074 [Hortaea werneckii]
MGRLATSIAAAAADADNMPPTEKLPSASIIDALLPRRLASIGSPSSKEKPSIGPTLAMPLSDYLRGMKPFRLIPIDADTGKPTDPNIGRKTYVTYYDVRKSRNGSKSIVAHKSASSSAASGNGKGGANAQGGETVNSGRKAQDGGGQSGGQKGTDGNKASQSEFSAEEDAKLKELKDTNTSWKDIAEQMNRPVQELKNRWGQIKPNVNEQKPQQQQGKGNGKGKQNQQNNQQGKQGGKPQTKEQEEVAAKKREERQKRREEASKPISLAPAPAPSPKPASAPINPKNPTAEPINPTPNLPIAAADTGDETRFTLTEWLTLQSDNLFTISELQFLSEIIMRDQNQTWLRIASVFYDKTGRKVHPEDIREKFERMAGMG